MSRSAVVLPLLFAAGLLGQTVETIPLRAVLSSADVTQPDRSGNAIVFLNVIRDADGQIVSGSATADVGYNLNGNITGIQVRRGPAGGDGAVVLPFTITPSTGAGAGRLPAVQSTFPSNSITLDTIRQIAANPQDFHFTVAGDSQNTLVRGQLRRAETIVRMAMMRPENEVPAITGQPWEATGTLMLLLTRNNAGAPDSGYVIFDVAYRNFPTGTAFTGLHIHRGAPGVNGPVTIDSGLRGQVPADVSGSGVLHFESDVDMNRAGALESINLLLTNPSQTYMNLHTVARPGGAVRGQMLFTDRMEFNLNLTTANEVPPITGLDARAPGRVTVYTVRGRNGNALAGAVVFNVNPAFPQGTQFTGLHIHDAIAGANGSVTIDSRLNASPILVGPGGTGNITRLVTVGSGQALASLNSLLVNPQRHYVNLHTDANRGGAVRAQLSPVPGLPQVANVFGGAPRALTTQVAPGGPIIVRGTSLAPVATDLSGFNNLTALPQSLNGVSLTLDGLAVPLTSISGTEIVGQVPFEVNPGQRLLIVTTPGGASQSFIVNVASAAPVILTSPNGAVAERANGTPITQFSPASQGETIYLSVVGLGQTNPPLQTGQIVGAGGQFTAGQFLDARIGGRNTTVFSATAVPGSTAVYRVAVRVPDGIMPGNTPMLLQSGLITSNVVALPVQ